MEKSFNMVVEETKQDIINSITKNKLPATVTQMILREILQGVELQTSQILQQEKIQYQKLIQENNKKVKEDVTK